MSATPLLAEQFHHDPRIAQAKRLLHEALAEHQGKFTAPRAADPHRAATYADTIARFGDIRGGALYFPYLASGLGRGALVELADGSIKYDMISGIGVHHLGHSNPRLVEALVDAALRDTVMQGNLQQGTQALEFSQELLAAANRESSAAIPAKLEDSHGRASRLRHCFLTTSGAMANENALKMILQKRSPAARLLAFEHCFMGRTLALSQITDKAQYRAGLPQVLSVDYVPFFDPVRPQESIDAATATLRQHLARYPGQHAAMGFELVQGEGGYWPGRRDFFVALMTILREQGVAIFVDEVQTFGRTHELFAFQHFDLDEYVDVVTLGKLTQVCATLFTDEYVPRAALISQTFTGATSSLLAAQVILGTLRSGGYFGADGRNAQVHRRFVQHFEAIGQRRPGCLSGPYGLGGMIALTPGDGSAETAKRVVHELFHAGVIAFVAGGAGGQPARVRFLPPVPALSDADIDAVCDILEKVLQQEE
ncbi:MAG: aminotransferase class III-fold pyridoxal phosphate-dependent enzyme [Phycisphaeraceae bacterium]